jgi:hypothetical protein
MERQLLAAGSHGFAPYQGRVSPLPSVVVRTGSVRMDGAPVDYDRLVRLFTSESSSGLQGRQLSMLRRVARLNSGGCVAVCRACVSPVLHRPCV